VAQSVGEQASTTTQTGLLLGSDWNDKNNSLKRRNGGIHQDMKS
jgi:hypothetical protein